jgi:hypothetical protein
MIGVHGDIGVKSYSILRHLGVIEYIYEYFLEIAECKFARNGLNNWKTFTQFV